MLFWVAAAVLTALCTAYLVRPLMARQPAEAEKVDAAPDDAHVAAYRAQFEELERDLAAGLIDAERAEALRTEISRRLLAADSQGPGAEVPSSPGLASSSASGRRRPILAIALMIAVPVTALGLYIATGSPDTPSQPLADRDPAERGAYEALIADIDRLARAAQDDPEDAATLTELGDRLMQLDRPAEAAQAYGRAVGLTGGDPDITSAYGEALVSADSGTVTAQALAAFEAVLDRRPSDPRARYYLGLARAQAGDDDGALARWTALVADSPADAPWLPAVRRQVTAAAERQGLDVAAIMPEPAPAAGPSQGDMDAAAAMAPEDRDAMVRSMVDGLAARLEDNPRDIQGWQRLGQSYLVIGETEEAARAFASAAALSPDDPRLLSVYADAILATGEGERLPPELAPVLQRLLALDDGNPRALWYLGLDAAAAGRPDEARGYWGTLLAQLDPESPEYEALNQQINGLD